PIVDIRGLDAGSNGIALTIQLHFSSDTDMAQIGGTIELDTDQNPFTGFPPAANFYIPGSTEDIGVDYVLNLFGLLTGGPIEVYAVNRQTPEGTVPATITGQTLEFSVPLTMLGGDDGSMNVGMALGNAVQPTDAAPDSGHGTITAGPTPVSGSVRGVAPRKVVCTNLTTRQDVTLHLKGAATWDCEAAGLVVHPGDVVVQKVKGTAN
ncbi:MAG TPA: hypothetical protein VE404_09920, partial [Verrucomicrobiae bacterium]|nr:hypothetical protein [Verrucomicrobiae bacterium]